MKLTHSPLLWKGPWSIDHLPMPHTYILASKSILSACKYILVPLLLNKEQTSKVLEKTSQADPTSILSFIVSFLGKGILYTCSINLFIFHSLLFKMTSLMHDFFNVSNSGAGGNERIKKKKITRTLISQNNHIQNSHSVYNIFSLTVYQQEDG